MGNELINYDNEINNIFDSIKDLVKDPLVWEFLDIKENTDYLNLI